MRRPKIQEPNLDPADVAAGPVAREVKARLMEGVPPPPFDRLTEQELRVATAYAIGTRRRDLARAMGLSVRTVDSHRGEAFEKLGVTTEAGLARLAIRVGLTSCDVAELRATLEALPEVVRMPKPHGELYQGLVNVAWRTIGGRECVVMPSRVNELDVTTYALAGEDTARGPWGHLHASPSGGVATEHAEFDPPHERSEQR